VFEGYLSFAGEEVANTQRLTAYVNAGLAPLGVDVNDCAECDTLALGLGDEEYRNPLLDRPGWVDDSDPNTYDFAGVLPLEITGLNGSTRTAEVTDLAGEGGVVRAPTYPARTIAVTAMLIGRTSAAVESGMLWLSTVLAGTGSCPRPRSAGSCAGDELCVLRYCPEIDEAEDITSWVSDLVGPERYEGIDGSWQPGGLFRPYGSTMVPKVNATNIATNPSMETGNGLPIAVETNQLVNPSAETAGGWASNYGAVHTLTRDTTVFHSGTQSVKSVVAGANTACLSLYGVGTTGTRTTLAAGSPVSAGVWVRTDTAGMRGNIALSFYDTGAAVIGSAVQSPYTNLTPNTWTWITFAAQTSPAGTASVYMIANIITQAGGNAAVGSVGWADDAILLAERGVPRTGYFDGDTPATDEFVYSWSGTAHASTSYKRFLQSATGYSGTGLAASGYSSGWAAHGTKSARAYSKYNLAGSGYIDLGPLIEWGKAYTVGVKVRLREANPNAPIITVFTTGNGANNLAAVNSIAPSTQPGVYDLKLTFTMPPNLGGAKYLRMVNSSPYGYEVWWDDLYIVEGTYSGGYFDGSTPAVSGHTYAWTGAANASTSTDTVMVASGWNPRIIGKDVYPCYSEGNVAVTLNSVAGQVIGRVELVGADGAAFYSTAFTFSGSRTITVPLLDTWEDWHVVVYIDNGAPVEFVSTVLTHHPVAGPEGCFDDATVSFANAACVAGPTVVESYSTGCGTVLHKVEWTWVAGSPFGRGNPTELVADMNLVTGKAGVKAYAVITRNPKDIAYSASVCVPEVDRYRPGLSDPCCGGAWVLPPKPPLVVDACFDPPASFARTELWIPPRYAPSNGWGALTLTIHNDQHAKRGMRMRVYPDPLRRGIDFLGGSNASAQECEFCEEWWFSYVEPNAETIVDGVSSRVWTRKTGYTDTDSSANVRGRNGGPFGFPTIDCNSGYLVVVDLPKTYPAACGSTIKAGDSQGSAQLDVTITPMGF
jgi:hypothetical protein